MAKQSASAHFSKKTLEFMRLAARQRHPQWLERNRDAYEAHILGPFQNLARTLKSELAHEAPGYHFPQKGIARMKRSAHKALEYKSLYKDWLSYNVTKPSGSRFDHNPNVYFIIQANEEDREYFILAGGLYMPSSRQMRSIREAIANNARPFEELFKNRAFSSRFPGGLSLERTSSRVPRGFDPAHPKMKWIQLQAFFVWRSYSLKEVGAPDFARKIARDSAQILKLNALLERAIQGNWATLPPPQETRRSTQLDQRIEEIQAPRVPMDF
jgi:uncharacterized protein (TIGR02453 family)